jgi:glutaryl-CoA dehydrogenase
MVLYEIARLDTGLSLLFFLQNSLGIQVLEATCNEEQKQRFLPDLIALKKWSCFCLTEPDSGSDATAGMKTNAKKVEGGYILNGSKRWPGNSVIADYSIVWAKNLSDGNKI